jgi:hypothetical protein
MAYLKPSQVVLGSLLLAAAMTGCVPAHPVRPPVAVRPAPLPPPPPPPPPPKLAKVVVLPLDKAALPDKADEINAKLAAVRLPGADAPVLATVSMETAQLQAECADPTETCYLKIARLVEADRLLWAQVENVGKGKKKKGKPSFKLQVTLFDRDKLAVAGKADETFAGTVSEADLDKLITTATGVAPGAQVSTTPPPAAPPPAAPPPPARPAATANPAYAPQPARPATAPAPAAQPMYQPQPAQQPGYAAPAAPAQAPPAYAPPAASAPAPGTYAPPPAAAPAPGNYAPAAPSAPSAPRYQ